MPGMPTLHQGPAPARRAVTPGPFPPELKWSLPRPTTPSASDPRFPRRQRDEGRGQPEIPQLVLTYVDSRILECSGRGRLGAAERVVRLDEQEDRIGIRGQHGRRRAYAVGILRRRRA